MIRLIFGTLIGLLVMAVIVLVGWRPRASGIAGMLLLALITIVPLSMPDQPLCALPGVLVPTTPFLLLLLVAAVVAGGAIAWWFRVPAAGNTTQASVRSRLELAMLAISLALALIAAGLGQITLPRALLLGLSGGAAIVAAIELRDALRADAAEVRSAWGGLGDGLGGWELSRPAVLLLALAILAATAVFAAAGSPPGTPIQNEPLVYARPC